MENLQPEAQQLLHRVCTKLQERDKKLGLFFTYIKAYDQIARYQKQGPTDLCLSEILDDAINCSLIEDAEYNIIWNHYNNPKP